MQSQCHSQRCSPRPHTAACDLQSPKALAARQGRRRARCRLGCQAESQEADQRRTVQAVDLTVDGKQLQCDVDVADYERVYTALLGKPMGLILVGVRPLGSHMHEQR